MTEITIKRGVGVPASEDIVEAELALDISNGTLYSKLADGTVAALNEGGGVDYTLPVTLRSGNAQLPLTVDGAKLAVMTRGGELELPLAA
jgi:hypothetical protein